MSERLDIESDILEWMGESPWQPDEDRFDGLARRLFAFQFSANEPYGRFCRARGRTPANVSSWREIPAVPAGAFKEMELRCFPAQETRHVFRTSGTSGGKRGALHLDTLALYEASLRPTLRELLFPDLVHAVDASGAVTDLHPRTTLRILAPAPEALPDSSLSYMFGCLMKDMADAESDYDVRDEKLCVDALVRALEKACDENRPVALCGTAFSFVHMLDAFAERGVRIVCPDGSRLMETGGFKTRSRELSRDTLYAALHESLGIRPDRIVNQYGMTELGSQFYDSVIVSPTTPRRKLGPPWVQVRLVDPETGEDVEGEGPGLVVLHDLANTGSVAALQTADLGRWIEAGGAAARGFEILGREEGAEARGCSIAADLMLGDPT